MALAVLLWVAGIGTAQKKASSAEQELMDAVNRERKERSLSILKWDDGLAHAASKHAELMAEQKLLLHQLPKSPSWLCARTKRGQDSATYREHRHG